MRKYNSKEEKQNVLELKAVICNQCGKELQIENGIQKEDACSVEKRWGYFSEKDTEIHSFDLCEACYDKLITSFKVPVEVKEEML